MPIHSMSKLGTPIAKSTTECSTPASETNTLSSVKKSLQTCRQNQKRRQKFEKLRLTPRRRQTVQRKLLLANVVMSEVTNAKLSISKK